MSTVTEIERAIERLTPEELRAFRAWFAERDRQFEADEAGGRLGVANQTLEYSVAARYRRVLPAWTVTLTLVAWAMVLASAFLQPIVPIGVAVGSLSIGAISACGAIVACVRWESRGKLAVAAVVLNLGYWGFFAFLIVPKLMA